MTSSYTVLIVGGGTAGITVAARLRNLPEPPEVAIIEPAEMHYYQPIWTLVGAGVFTRESSGRPEADFIPEGCTWIRDRVESFQPGDDTVTTADGRVVGYEYLVVAAGIQLDWNKVKGLEGNVGKHGICSNYSYETVDSTWACIRDHERGRALFTFPNTPIKCGGAPQKIMYLADEAFRRQGVRDESEVHFIAPGAAIFGVPKYRRALEKIVARKGIDTHFRSHLVEIEAEKKRAHIENLDSNEVTTLDYEMIHVTPPQGPPNFIASSDLANDAGWVDVDKYTMQHVRFPNVFSLGDCSSLPCAKTGAAVRKQAPVLVHNLRAHRAGESLDAAYDGYSSCPLVTGYGKLILAEFDYDGKPVESFPFDQAQERWSMYALKAYGLPKMYWHGMLRGRA